MRTKVQAPEGKCTEKKHDKDKIEEQTKCNVRCDVLKPALTPKVMSITTKSYS